MPDPLPRPLSGYPLPSTRNTVVRITVPRLVVAAPAMDRLGAPCGADRSQWKAVDGVKKAMFYATYLFTFTINKKIAPA